MTKTKLKVVETLDEVDRTAPLRAFLEQEDERVSKIMSKLESCYVGSRRDDEITEQLKRLIRNSLKRRFPARPEGDGNRKAGVGFAVVGKSGSGKTTALETILANHPAFPGYAVPKSGCVFISVLVPSPCTLAQFGNAVLEELGYDTETPLRENEAWKRVRALLKKKRIMFLHFDDVHNVLHQASAREIKKIQDTLRNLMISRTWPVQLVLSGIDASLGIFKKDRQLRRRLKYVVFDDLVPADDVDWIRDAVKDFVKAAGLKYVERPGAMLIERLFHAAAYQFGLLFEILLEAIEMAVSAKRLKFGIEDLEKSYADRTAQPDNLNVFSSPAWQTIDPSVIFENEDDEEEETKSRKKSEVRRFE